ncbi:MAG: ferrochelatase [Anaerolineae bacterium]|nr:ferrochelatase [Anaerolineae bacterium]
MDQVKTAVVLLNLGGPSTPEEVGPFLERLFADPEIIPLPFQSLLGKFIARVRTPKVRRKYVAIGCSPILRWTQKQGEGMVHWLDELSPETAPHRFYIAFRYTPPFSQDALLRMRADGVKRAVALTLYPQYSCATTGSSLNELWRAAHALGLEHAFQWSVVDRWFKHPGFIEAMAQTIHQGLATFDPAVRDKVVLLFSAHSLPMRVVSRGDAYPREVEASVRAVLDCLQLPNPHRLAYQSAVGPIKWLGPSTEEVIAALGKAGEKHVLVVPIAFVSDHIETLHEIDVEYAELAHKVGIAEFRRAPALNDQPRFLQALAEIVVEHLRSKRAASPQYAKRCIGCQNAWCRTVLNPVSALS